MQKNNSKDWATPYSCKFMEAGIISYEDSNAGIALIKKEVIEKMAPTFVGKPVIINHQSVDPSNFEKVAVGYVTKVWFCPEDAWFYADFIILNDEAKDLIDNQGYSVSCAYNVLDVAEGGLWHDIKFDAEIIDGSFTHLALVQTPRYEESKITKTLPTMLVNGKEAHYQKQEELPMFKIFKKKENEKQEEVANLHVAIEGKVVPVADLVTSYLNSKQNEKQDYTAKDEDLIDINGNKVSIAELKSCYMASKKNEKSDGSGNDDAAKEAEKKNEAEKKEAEEKKNAAEEEAKKKKEEEMKNAAEEEKKKEEEKKNAAEKEAEEEKKNAKAKGDEYFAELKNAGKQFIDSESETPAPLTRAERAARWASKNKKN